MNNTLNFPGVPLARNCLDARYANWRIITTTPREVIVTLSMTGLVGLMAVSILLYFTELINCFFFFSKRIEGHWEKGFERRVSSKIWQTESEDM